MGGFRTIDLSDDAVESRKIKDAEVVKADLKVYISAERSGTGVEESIEHGLGVTPSNVFCALRSSSSATDYSIVEGTHDATYVKVNVTSGAKYQVIAIA